MVGIERNLARGQCALIVKITPLKWKWGISLALDVDVNEVEFVKMPIILSFALNIYKAQELPRKLVDGQKIKMCNESVCLNHNRHH